MVLQNSPRSFSSERSYKLTPLAPNLACTTHNFFYVAKRPPNPYEAMQDERARFGTTSLSHNHALHPSHVAFFSCDFEVAIDDTISQLAYDHEF